MASRKSKRKRPDREEHREKEQDKIEEGVFDRRATLFLSKFFNKGVISRLLYPIARGKESDIYLAEGGPSVEKDFVILKFYRVETTSFYAMTNYIEGDPRFITFKKSRIDIIKTWCKKEYGNLQIANTAGVKSPYPYMFNGSILAMEFIGKEGLLRNLRMRFWKIRKWYCMI